jgi:hypothetical protein
MAGPAMVLVLSTWCQLHGRALGVDAVSLAVSLPWAIRSTLGWMLAGLLLAYQGEKVLTSSFGARRPWATRALMALAIPCITMTNEVLLLSGDTPFALWVYNRLPLHLPFGIVLFGGYVWLRTRHQRTAAMAAANAASVSEMAPLTPPAATPSPPEEITVEVMTGTGRTFVPLGDIECLEADRNYINVHTPQRSYLLRQTLTSLEKSLRPEVFLRVHRSTIVNRAKIRERRRGGVLVMDSGRQVRVSRAFADRVN